METEVEWNARSVVEIITGQMLVGCASVVARLVIMQLIVTKNRETTIRVIVTINRETTIRGPKILLQDKDKAQAKFDVKRGRCGGTVEVKDKTDRITERLLKGELTPPHMFQ